MNEFIANLMDPFANYNKAKNICSNIDLYYDDYRILYDIDIDTKEQYDKCK